MDNASVVDGAIAIVLIAGALIGAKRGLIRSLTGLAVVVVSFLVAAELANALTAPITDVVAPKVEESLVQSFREALEREKTDNTLYESFSELLKKYNVPEERVRTLLAPLRADMGEITGAAQEKVAESFRAAISAGVYAVVRGAVHALLLFVLYVVLRIVLELVLRALDLIFDLPVLNTLNTVGGALLGVISAALLLFVGIHVGLGVGWSALTEASDSVLLPLFLALSPID